MSQYNGSKKAVALKYDESQGTAPIIVASGLGHMAEKIVEVANQSDVPVYEDTSLATVLSQLELGAQIPEEVYRAVVEIYVFFLNLQSK
ncbi:EscU/YscU/HrcU family type III secretion system export apparatus switch protein [Aminipila sp.]|uniref:EscU/YscU/HrcU family type III secretion system export apparatus switch protein n=1 Tax=Aminipila sp. TaxID=2060095 RepID=UPI0028A27FAA|nr:EscU/YscU/HrcU family type III secretion system export apparatus switch protein [Aminipila sp.]